MFTLAIHGMRLRADMSEITVKRITPDMPDSVFAELSALDGKCFGAESWSANDFFTESEKNGGIVLAAYCGDSLAGLFAGFTASDTGEVLTLAVEPNFRRNGIARKLLDAFFELVPSETENIALEVRCSNTAAITLYESFGFEKAGVRRRFYQNPDEDADIMVKTL